MGKIGRYEIEGMLGKGAMGVVYKAFDPSLERYAAIKVMNTVGPVSEELRTRFFHEARSAAKLNHPNIISVYDLGEDNGIPYIAMEYLEGEDLKVLIENQSFVPFDQKIRLVLSICEGLDYAHRYGVVHRDIKPANVFVTRDGRPKIVDFGVARLVASDLTDSGSIIGSPYYMSPEQVKGLPDVDGRSDLFSVGVLLYEWISQRRPFEGDTPTAVCFRIISEAHTPMPEILPGCATELAEIVDRALSKERGQRYQSGAELAEDLSRFEERLPRTQTTLKKEIETLEKKFKEQKLNLNDPVVEDLVAGRLQLDATDNPDDYGSQLVRHADLSKASQILNLRREKETHLQLNAALAVARSALDQKELETCLKAVSAVFKVVPSHAEALVLKRRALLQQKVGGRLGKTGGKEDPVPPQAARSGRPKEVLREIAELLDFASAEVNEGNLQTGLRSLSFLLLLDPDHPGARELKERTEASMRELDAPGEASPRALQETRSIAEATQRVEGHEGTQVVPSEEKPTRSVSRPRRPRSSRGFPRLAWIGASLAAAALIAAVAIWSYSLLLQEDGGTLVLNVVPWANVDSITDLESGEVLPIEANLAAPCVITLPAGNYRVRVSHPHFAQSEEFEVSIDARLPSVIQKTLTGIDLEKEISKAIGE